MNYKLTRYVSYKEKNNIIAVYSNFNLMFFKGDTAMWFKKIVNKENIDEIPKKYLEYLQRKEVIELD
ncbi:MAG: hypothetical protein J6K42_05470 [Clostridia bacterium]|nr:hypothetical protein [Clostridia bacterium]